MYMMVVDLDVLGVRFVNFSMIKFFYFVRCVIVAYIVKLNELNE